jgi:hypothetical protein
MGSGAVQTGHSNVIIVVVGCVGDGSDGQTGHSIGIGDGHWSGIGDWHSHGFGVGHSIVIIVVVVD